MILLLATSLSAATIVWTPQFQGSVNLQSQSHGSGYSPYANEFWVPYWGSQTVYRYDRNYNLLGSFNTGQDHMMQLWGDTDGSYYTANWQYYTVTKRSGSSTVWSYNIGGHAGGVAADANYVYAMRYDTNIVYRLNKSTGALVNTFTLDAISGGGAHGGIYMYGGLAVVGDYLIRGNGNGVIEYFNLTTGNRLGSFSTGSYIYGSAFDGTNYYVHQNGSTHQVYTIATNLPIPEPASLVLLGLSAVALIARRMKKF